MNSICNSCLDEEGEENNPDVGTRNYLINAGLYEMCNVNDDNESGFQEPGVAGVPTWFQKQQDANLLGLSVDPDNKDLFEIETPSMISLNSFSDMLSGLQYDSAFESCVNDKLHTPGDNDLEIQNRIADYTSIKEFTNVDISLSLIHI